MLRQPDQILRNIGQKYGDASKMKLRRPSATVVIAAIAAAVAAGCATAPAAEAPKAAAPAAAAPAAKPAAPAAAAAPAATAVVAKPASFAICGACHATTADAPPGVGPNLHAIGGKKAGSADPDFEYSDALKTWGKVWTPETLHAFISAPGQTVPGNKMDFPGSQDQAITDY